MDESDTWSLVDFVVPSELAELVSDALWMRGVVAIEERDESSGFLTLRTSMGDDPRELIRSVAESFPSVASALVHVPRSIADTWRQYATPTFVDETVVLVPAWQPAPDASQPVFIEPLDTFGLGNHPTTVLALRLALRHVREGSTVFDLGSGSGVLAVGLAKFRGCTVMAYDIAESAHDALLLNAQRNEVTTVAWRQGIEGTVSHCVVANILAPVLIAESQNISHAVEDHGFVILSGMRDEQVEAVTVHFDEFAVVDSESMDGWTAVALQKAT